MLLIAITIFQLNLFQDATTFKALMFYELHYRICNKIFFSVVILITFSKYRIRVLKQLLAVLIFRDYIDDFILYA